MDRTERFYKIHRLLNDRRCVPLEAFLDELGVSRATFKRDLEYMRDRLHAPIVWDRAHGGYRYEAQDPHAPPFALPGLWFNASEIHALLTMQHLLQNIQPGLLEPHVQPLLARIRMLLQSGDHSAVEVGKRIRILDMAARPVMPRHFETVCDALLSRRRLHLVHYNRARDVTTERDVSPQRLVHYRDNWYLDAWCHLRRGLRSFAVDSIRDARMLEQTAQDVADGTLDAELGSGYGIFAGRDTRTARLRFTPLRARWVADERWHPQQRGYRDEEGYYVLEVPYSDPRELIMDVLKHGAEVEVLDPPELREALAQALERAVARYRRER
ncbi:MAG: YafY family transcriptional regulator [Gammaproteobacteria bacterium]|nr:YafY family transcriptional regulator [Gammaproteobacteria bacterium]NIR84819.1 YafY family transcriptional regulator [Gammaproteobacteria bacterium]NIR91533.1 YafY family transcriptional regulator [Gammaproteobacteria bacterium]NIU05866.1 YafY family transcriptional regulator [Gammaproteobacteria bacterium]NIV76721.1 WYL domain-containing protein [Gammaproteobacteria bacterium]